MTESITELIAGKITEREFRLPVFNPVALELQSVLDSELDMKALEQLILKDPALASEILRVANSAFFSGLAKLDSIHQALVRLGINQVFNIVMVASQRQAFSAKDAFLNGLMAELWRHAAASAGGCRWLAIKSGHRQLAEPAFLAGLLHDLGSLVILKVLDEILQQPDAPQITEAVIVELIATLHTQYGYKVMQSWQLPERYTEIARDHHLDGCDDKNVLLQMVRLVDAACRKLAIGLSREPDLVLEAVPEAHLLGVKAVHLAELEIELEEFIEQLSGQ